MRKFNQWPKLKRQYALANPLTVSQFDYTSLNDISTAFFLRNSKAGFEPSHCDTLNAAFQWLAIHYLALAALEEAQRKSVLMQPINKGCSLGAPDCKSLLICTSI
jgi:hypothetical protein